MSADREQPAGGDRQDNDLSERLAALEQACWEARATADRAVECLDLMRAANDIADAAGTAEAFGNRYLQHLCSVLDADGAALLRNEASTGGFVTFQHVGSGGVAEPIVPHAAMPEYECWSAPGAGRSVLDDYGGRSGHHSLAWVWRPADNIALILGRGEDGAAKAAFSTADKEVVRTALGIYVEVKRRKRSLEALVADKEAAERANMAKSRFLAMMSHEVRTPLNAILGYAEMITTGLVGPPTNPKTLESAEIIHASGLHLLGIITDILDISRVEAGKLELDDAPTDLDPLLVRAVDMVRRQAVAAGVDLSIESMSTSPGLLVDHRLVLQALTNLIMNAVKFSDRGGEVVVRVTRGDDGGVDIAVKDAGPGMNEREVAIALRPFGQVDGRHRRLNQGIGLGLPLAKSFIEKHGGRLSIDSAPGRGTSVIVHLPADRVLGSAAAPAANPTGMPGSSAS